MSSLSQQLKAISEKNASVALDRKSRALIHSRSLVFDPKVAAAQDFEYIYQVAREGLDELVSIDARFGSFYNTLFAETSINFDRNVQTKEILRHVEKNITAFVNLAAPYLLLSPALKAMEWVVRRYHANIHNPELMLLAAMPYHNQPVFTRFMLVVPKNSWPAIFSSISGYKDSLTPPPASSILKSFHNDPALFRLYSQHMVECLRNKTVYKEQLVFYLANTAQVLASHTRDVGRLNDEYIPTILEAAVEFFRDHEFRYSATLASDVRLTIYSIVSVMCALVPLQEDLVFSLTRSVVQSELAFSPSLKRHTLIVLGQLWTFYNEDDIPSERSVFEDVPVSALLEDNGLLLHTLDQEKYNLDKFLYFFFTDKLNHGDADAVKVLPFIRVASSPFLFSGVAHKLLRVLGTPVAASIKAPMADVFVDLVKSDKNRFLSILDTENKSLADLEMALSRTLVDSEPVEDAFETVEVSEASGADITTAASSADSFFAAGSAEFHRLAAALVNHLYTVDTGKQVQGMFDFLSATVAKVDSRCSFMVRLALTPSIPSHVRLVALKGLKTTLISEQRKEKTLAVYLLVPVLLLGTADANKTIRGYFISLLEEVKKLNSQLVSLGKKADCTLFMESQIYGETPAGSRSIVSPQDAELMLQAILDNQQAIADIRFDGSRTAGFVFDDLFHSSIKKKFGPLIKTFVLSQWAQVWWPLSLKSRVWSLVAQKNVDGCEDRFAFADDLKAFVGRLDEFSTQASADGIEMEAVENAVVGMVGEKTEKPKSKSKNDDAFSEIDWLLQALGSSSLQRAANARLVALFPSCSTENRLRICSELVELVVRDSDENLEFDPVETLQQLDFSSAAMISLLSTVNIVTQIPEQGVAKRRRRSSSSTQKKMAQDEISAMASQHLKKLSVILDVLEAQLRREPGLASPDLLQAMFKILTDLDYLCNDGKMPVLYAQETLAACMLLAIVEMKNSPRRKKLDSNSVRADLIVNSIRLSQSPQVQNRLLLVIAELASLAPEIILHSVMPIFTFMGAHTIRQDDEFSSSALQQTIAKVVPAITAASDSPSTEIEFLLTSFITAFQHIPRHRRVRLFVSLVQTLSCSQSLHTILFLIGQQYAHNVVRHRTHEGTSLLDFVVALMRTFSAAECMESLHGFFELWNGIPSQAVEKDTPEFAALSGRSIYGAAVASLSTKELLSLKARLLQFVNQTLDDDGSSVSLKMKVSLVLFDSESSKEEKEAILASFNRLTAFILGQLETLTGDAASAAIVDNLYESLKALLNLLPLSHYVGSITDSLQSASDAMSIKVAKNFAVLAGQRVEAEVTQNTLDTDIESAVVESLLPVLVEGVEKFSDVELLQAYLDTYAVVVHKLGTVSPEFAENARFLVNSLRIITSDNGLLSGQPELVVSSLNAITSVVNLLGVKCIGYFPKILPPALEIWKTTEKKDSTESGSDSDSDSDSDSEDSESALVQGAVLMLVSCLVKRLPAFVVGSLPQMFNAILLSEHVDSSVRSGVLDLVVEHLDSSAVLQSLCNLALDGNIYAIDSAQGLGLYLSCMRNAIDKSDKKAATGQRALFMRWMIASFEFRSEHGARFSDNTIHSIEGSVHTCGLQYVMKLNDKNFRPLFASLVRWAVSGEGSSKLAEEDRLVAFFKFFNKLQDSLRSIVTSYFSYLLDATVGVLQRFASDTLQNTNLRRIVLHSLASSFKYDQDDYWSHQSRFSSVVEPLLAQLGNIEDSIGKHLVKAIGFFVANVSSDEYNDKLVHTLIRYVSNEHDNSAATKIWTIRVLKTVFQKMGEQWLSYLPTFIPYIAELLEDDDEEVEMEVRKDLVRVIENILGEPLDRYLS